ncbi:hypothetical protein ENHY17A_10063 [Moraxellaceae bacterium 17A]|nr:hypothetical protein ENHY17A_10063 [Moraxellaceae bacterium 17A]
MAWLVGIADDCMIDLSATHWVMALAYESIFYCQSYFHHKIT